MWLFSPKSVFFGTNNSQYDIIKDTTPVTMRIKIMAIFLHLAGLCFFAVLAVSGFAVTAQVLYWIILVPLFLIGLMNYTEATRNIKRVKDGKQFTSSLQTLLPYLIDLDFNSRIIHLIFANIFHAAIAFVLLQAPVLAIATIIVMALNVTIVYKFKGIINNVVNDTSR